MPLEPQDRYEDLQRRYNRIAENATLSDIHDRVKSLSEQISELPDAVASIRERGYVYRSYLENKAEVFAKQWAEKSAQVLSAVQQEATKLSAEIARPKTLLLNAERQTDNETLFERLEEQAEDAIKDLEDAVREAGSRVEDFFQTLETDVLETYSQITGINWVLDMRDEASFDFNEGEDVFLAAKAELVLTGKGRKDPDGILFLTDQRLALEQKERKGGVLGFGSKKHHDLAWEAPLQTIDSIEVENKGMFGGKDMMHFSLNDGDLREVTIEVKGSADNKFWEAQINRMIEGETDDERAIKPDEEMLESLKNAPTACHVCGGTLPQVTAGQSEITCKYCGATISL